MINENNKKILKKILGNNIYQNLTSKIRFNNLDSPFPRYKSEDFHMNWNKFLDSNKEIRAAYIISPMQRSGTNYLGHLLNLHPKLSYPESGLYPPEQCLYNKIEEIKKYSYETIKLWGKWTVESELPLQNQVKDLMSNIGDGILNTLSGKIKKDELLLLKTPDSHKVSDYFHLFPNTKIIFLLRDGRDTVESYMKSWGTDAIFKNLVERWNNRMTQIDDLIKKAHNSDFEKNIHVLKYNELNGNTQNELEKIFKYLNVENELYPWDKLADVPILGSSEFKNDDNKVHWKPIQKSDNFKPSGKWHNWSSKKKTIFKSIASEQVTKWGFEENNNW